MRDLLVSLLVCVMLVTYGLDMLPLSVGSQKIPLALVVSMGLLLGAVGLSAFQERVSSRLIAAVVIWVLLASAIFVSTMAGDQEFGDGDVRLLTYATALVPFVLFGAGARHEAACWGLTIGSAALVAVGFYRFVFMVGGDPIQHLFGYWGIKYTASTRNSDVLYPLVGLAAALHLMLPRFGAIRRIAALAVGTMFVMAIILSSSRGGWLAMGALFCLHAVRPSTRSMFLVLAVASVSGAILVAVLTVVPELGELAVRRAESLFSLEWGIGGSNYERWELLRAAAGTLGEHPFGVGVGVFGPEVRFVNESGEFLNHAENLFATVAVEQGLYGLAIYSALAVILARAAWTSSAAGGNIALVILVYSLFNYEANSLFFWIILGYAIGSGYVRSRPSRVQRKGPRTSSFGVDSLAKHRP